jgi:hypothetical protein
VEASGNATRLRRAGPSAGKRRRSRRRSAPTAVRSPDAAALLPGCWGLFCWRGRSPPRCHDGSRHPVGSSPLAPRRPASSPLAPRRPGSSPLAPRRPASSPLAPRRPGSSPRAPRRPGSSPAGDGRLRCAVTDAQPSNRVARNRKAQSRINGFHKSRTKIDTAMAGDNCFGFPGYRVSPRASAGAATSIVRRPPRAQPRTARGSPLPQWTDAGPGVPPHLGRRRPADHGPARGCSAGRHSPSVMRRSAILDAPRSMRRNGPLPPLFCAFLFCLHKG